MGMKHTEEAIALQAIEFWSTVCETEAELAWEAAEVRGGIDSEGVPELGSAPPIERIGHQP